MIIETIAIGLVALSAAGAVTWLAGGLILSLLGAADDDRDDPEYPFDRMAVGLLGIAILSGVLALAYLIGKAVTG